MLGTADQRWFPMVALRYYTATTANTARGDNSLSTNSRTAPIICTDCHQYFMVQVHYCHPFTLAQCMCQGRCDVVRTISAFDQFLRIIHKAYIAHCILLIYSVQYKLCIIGLVRLTQVHIRGWEGGPRWRHWYSIVSYRLFVVVVVVVVVVFFVYVWWIYLPCS